MRLLSVVFGMGMERSRPNFHAHIFDISPGQVGVDNGLVLERRSHERFDDCPEAQTNGFQRAQHSAQMLVLPARFSGSAYS